MEVHNAPGPELLESAYGGCLYFKYQKNGLSAIKKKPVIDI